MNFRGKLAAPRAPAGLDQHEGNFRRAERFGRRLQLAPALTRVPIYDVADREIVQASGSCLKFTGPRSPELLAGLRQQSIISSRTNTGRLVAAPARECSGLVHASKCGTGSACGSSSPRPSLVDLGVAHLTSPASPRPARKASIRGFDQTRYWDRADRSNRPP